MSEPGQIQAIWIKRMKRGPMDPVQTAQLETGRGLEGNANRGGWRQVTVLEQEAWDRATATLGVDLDPIFRRANLLVCGISLERTRGRVLRIGGCRIEIRGETKPCERMDEVHPGLKDALCPGWGGGAFGVVLEGGPIAQGDPVLFEDLPDL